MCKGQGFNCNRPVFKVLFTRTVAAAKLKLVFFYGFLTFALSHLEGADSQLKQKDQDVPKTGAW